MMARARLRAPFALFLGWMVVATIANVALVLTKYGVLSGSFEATWAAIMTIGVPPSQRAP